MVTINDKTVKTAKTIAGHWFNCDVNVKLNDSSVGSGVFWIKWNVGGVWGVTKHDADGDFCKSMSAAVNALTLLKRITQASVRIIDNPKDEIEIIPLRSGHESSIEICPSKSGSDNEVNIFWSLRVAFAILFKLKCNCWSCAITLEN